MSDKTIAEQAAELRRSPGYPCTVGLLAKEQPALYAELQEAITAGYSDGVLSKVLAERGIKILPTTMGRHRRGDCKCQ